MHLSVCKHNPSDFCLSFVLEKVVETYIFLEFQHKNNDINMRLNIITIVYLVGSPLFLIMLSLKNKTGKKGLKIFRSAQVNSV
jgi:hypothetical protein